MHAATFANDSPSTQYYKIRQTLLLHHSLNVALSSTSILKWLKGPVRILDQTNQFGRSIPVLLYLLSTSCLTVTLLHHKQHHLQCKPLLQNNPHLSSLFPKFCHLRLMQTYIVPFISLHLQLNSFLFLQRLCVFYSVFPFFLLALRESLVNQNAEVGVGTGRVSNYLLLSNLSYCVLTLLDLCWIFLNALDDFIQSHLFRAVCTHA